MYYFRPARPGLSYQHQMSPTGSTPNLAATSNYNTISHHWTSTTHLLANAGGPVGPPPDYRQGYNTISHAGGNWRDQFKPGTAQGGQPAATTATVSSHSTYAGYQPGPQPLGYIVAYTPEQLTDIMHEQQHLPSSPYHLGHGGFSPGMSPKRVPSHVDTNSEEFERKMLEYKLQWQQRQSEEDAKWLHREEENLVGLHVYFT